MKLDKYGQKVQGGKILIENKEDFERYLQVLLLKLREAKRGKQHD